jgi:hypothetical protein
MKREVIDWRIAATAIICLTMIEIIALLNGVNGTVRTIIFSLIALIVGVQMPQMRFNK